MIMSLVPVFVCVQCYDLQTVAIGLAAWPRRLIRRAGSEYTVLETVEWCRHDLLCTAMGAKQS